MEEKIKCTKVTIYDRATDTEHKFTVNTNEDILADFKPPYTRDVLKEFLYTQQEGSDCGLFDICLHEEWCLIDDENHRFIVLTEDVIYETEDPKVYSDLQHMEN